MSWSAGGMVGGLGLLRWVGVVALGWGCCVGFSRRGSGKGMDCWLLGFCVSCVFCEIQFDFLAHILRVSTFSHSE